ncbi:MAG: protein kinase domain-containing protein [Polyangia bacterium]
MPAETHMDTLVGTVLEGAYRITRLIGQGGMGAVYEAVQLRLNKRVAIKLMARDLAANHQALARFHREAEITSHLGHPHLVTVEDFGQAESGEPYLVMEYLEGEDLDHHLRRVGHMPIEAVAPVVRQVASALSAAHDQGIVHRDLKPGNIFLVQIPGEPDFVKVLDFGVSKMMAARTRLTNVRSTLGTPIYMSPEQAAGMVEEIDHRVDQWALACIAWEMLLGRPPFVADDVTALLFQIVKMDPQPLTPRVPGLPPAVETELRRALNKRPADRFPTIRAFSRAFATAAFGQPPDVTPAPVLLSSISPAVAKIGPSEALVANTPDTPLAAGTPPDKSTPQAASPPVGSATVEVRRRRRIKPVHAMVAAAVALLLLGAFVLVRWNALPKPASTKNPVSAPTIMAPLPPPPAPPAAKPEPSPVQPASVEPESPPKKPGKPAKTASPAGRERAKRPTTPSPLSKPKRQLIKDL